MKVRIGYGLGTQTGVDATGFTALVDGLETNGFDSLWLSERIGGPAPDPMVALAMAAGRSERLKFGTSVQVLSGRSPARVASAWATLDVLSGGRALPAFGLGIVDPSEQQAFGIERSARAAWFDEALPLVRRFWTEDRVTHHGDVFHYDDVRVLPKPVQQLPDVWMGGRAPAELRRIGRLADGWLASFQTAGQVAAGKEAVEQAAAEAGRDIDPDHYGTILLYTFGPVPDRFAELIRARFPDAKPDELVATTTQALRDRIQEFTEVGVSKFVLAPLTPPEDFGQELETLAELLDLET